MFNYQFTERNYSSSLWSFPDRSLEPYESAELPEPSENEILDALEDGIKTKSGRHFFERFFHIFLRWVSEGVDKSELRGEDELWSWAYGYIDILLRDTVDTLEEALYSYPEEEVTMEEILEEILEILD